MVELFNYSDEYISKKDKLVSVLKDELDNNNTLVKKFNIIKELHPEKKNYKKN